MAYYLLSDGMPLLFGRLPLSDVMAPEDEELQTATQFTSTYIDSIDVYRSISRSLLLSGKLRCLCARSFSSLYAGA